MSNLIEIDINEINNFNYEQLDKDTSKELKNITTELSAINSNFKYNVGKQLNKAQELLSKNGYGCFTEWFESYGLKKDKVYDWIRYYKVFVGNSDNKSKLEKISDSKIYEIGKLEQKQQKEVLENINLENMTTQEVKKLTRQLKDEKEYSQELQEAIKEKEKQIRTLKNEIENIQVPEKEIIEKEVIKEVIPEDLILEKQSLEKELETLRKRAEKAEDTIKSIKLETKIQQDNVFDTAKLDMLLSNVRDFLSKNSKFTYLKEDLQNIPPKKRKFVEQAVNSIKEWTVLMEQALDNRQDMVGNIIYGEGEIINE